MPTVRCRRCWAKSNPLEGLGKCRRCGAELPRDWYDCESPAATRALLQAPWAARQDEPAFDRRTGAIVFRYRTRDRVLALLGVPVFLACLALTAFHGDH